MEYLNFKFDSSGSKRMKQILWNILYKLSELGAGYRTIKTSTMELAKILDISQQTASRNIIELEKIGCLVRNASYKGIEIKITKKGIEELQKVYLGLKSILENAPSIIELTGNVFSGFGEGGYYVSREGYRRQFERKLGFKPYPGTLNLKLPITEIVKKKELETYPAILIKGFETHNRLFGDVRCYMTTINDEVDGAFVVIDRTHHDDSIVEIIAPVNLRNRLNFKDGSKVTLKFILQTKSKLQNDKV